ncbi:MAG: LytTR family DNA-binding domain-containing protein [Bacteroidales bacterium]
MDHSIQVLIVDDEPEARELLRYMLQEEEGVELAGEAGDVDEAIRIMKRNNPGLVILDIQMPGKDGFHFIEQIHQQGYQPGIILVTGYENYAIRAIRSAVFDYILKPVRRQELSEAISRYRKNMNADRKQDIHRLVEALHASAPGKIKLNTRSGYILVNPAEVVYCKADGNYTYVQLLNGNQELTTHNLGAIEEMLQSGSFFRASRSYLVNVKYLSRVDRKNCSCTLEYSGSTYSFRIPAQKIRLLEASF